MSYNIDSIRSAKRSKNEKTNVHGWHPYYAGYSEGFVEDIIDLYNIRQEDIIFDPWVGSGTTTVVAQNRGIRSMGVDINPVMVDFARAKSAKLIQLNLLKLAELIIEKREIISVEEDRELNKYLSLQQIIYLNSLKAGIYKVIKEEVTDFEIINAATSFYMAALYRTIRKIGNFKKGSNPTWLSSSTEFTWNEDLNIVVETFYNYVRDMENDIYNKFNKLESYTAPLPNIFCSDAKDLKVDNNCIDYIITSPPYLTRIDYAISTKPEILYLSQFQKLDFNDFRRKFTGAPTISDKSIMVNNLWGMECSSVINKITEHPAKASKSYYLPFYLQYFKGMFESFQEINRVLRKGGKAFVVVQTSYFKEIEIQLGEILKEMAINLGLEASTIKRETIKQHIAHVNTKSSVYVKNKVYYEECLMLEKRG